MNDRDKIKAVLLDTLVKRDQSYYSAGQLLSGDQLAESVADEIAERLDLP